MFSFINEDDVILYGDDEDSISQYFYEFNLTAEDYFLNRRMEWDLFEARLFIFNLQGKAIGIPSGFYVMVADVMGCVDWIQVDELIGRDLDVLIIAENFASWSLERIELVDEQEKFEFYWPVTKNVLPISPIHGSSSLIVSKTDRYKDTKDKSVDTFVTI